MHKRVLALSCFLFILFVSVPSASASEQGFHTGTLQIQDREYQNNTLAFTAALSGETGTAPQGQIAVCVYTESRQMKSTVLYPAKDTVDVSLQNVSNTDYVKAFWLDDGFCPLAEPSLLRMSGNDAEANAKFTGDLVRMLGRSSGGAGAADFDTNTPYGLARLIVRCDTLPDLAGRGVTDKVAGPGGIYVLQFQSANAAENCAKYLMTLPSVYYAEPDAVINAEEPVSASFAELADASAHLSWGVDASGIGQYAASLKKTGVTGGVTVAVVDSGVDIGHPFLSERLLRGYDILNDDDNPQDENGHGTHVAGIVADCTAGLDVKILPVRVLNHEGVCYSLVLIANGIRYAADHGANIINLSLGAPASRCIDDAVLYAVSKNITVVSASGNNFADTDTKSPARVKDGITVAAVNETRGRFPHSNYGDAVDLCAPGEAVNSAYLRGKGDNHGDYRILSGTSMAAPHVSAAAALLMCERGTSQTPAQISETLRSAASEADLGEPGWDKYYGEGLLNMLPFVQATAYAILYDNGEMVFQSTNTPAAGRTVVETYPITVSDGGAQYAAWYDRRDSIVKVIFADTIQPESTALWFYGCGNLAAVEGLENLDTSNVTNMSQMFAKCWELTELDLTNFDTSNVTSMGQMFFDCAMLETIYASNRFATSAVTSSQDMFDGCAALTGGSGTSYDSTHTDKDYARLDGGVSAPGYFTDVNKELFFAVLYDDGELAFQNNERTEAGRTVVEIYRGGESYSLDAPPPWFNMNGRIKTVTFADRIQPFSTAYWFHSLGKLTCIKNIENLDTSRVTDMHCMFYDCSSLVSLDVSGFETGNVTLMTRMFYGCSELTSLDVSGFDTRNVTKMNRMFCGCSKLTGLDVSCFDTGKTTTMGYMFHKCSRLTSLDISRFDTSSVTDMENMFYGCSNLKSIYVSNQFVTTQVENSSGMFSDCTSLIGSSGTSYDSTHTDKEYARIDGGSSRPGYFSNPLTRKLYKCGNNLTASLDSNGALTITGTGGMYDYTDSNQPWPIEEIVYICIEDGVTSIGASAFDGCSRLLSVKMPDQLDGIGVSAFNHCASLTTLSVSGEIKRIGVSAFDHCTSLAELNITGSVDSIGVSCFAHCINLKEVNISGTIGSIGVSAFKNCSNLINLSISTGIKSIGTGAFQNCTSLIDFYYAGTPSQWDNIDIGVNAIPSSIQVRFNNE